MAPELLIVIVGTVSCVAFFSVILILVLVLYRKDSLCCRFRPYTDDPQQYHSRQTLMDLDEHRGAMNQGATGQQLPGRMFIVGKPNDYHMEGPLPRLPTYESVRKMDRQRQIHLMIAQRFGFSSCSNEPPPTYEETLRESINASSVSLHSLDTQLLTHPHDDSSNLRSSHCPAESSRFLSI